MRWGGITGGEKFTVKARSIINCAGLFSNQIAAMLGLDVNKLGYRLQHCKGDYFRISGKPPVKMLIYPVPKGAGLDIHLIRDMAGMVKLGPNGYYVNKIDYKVESNVEQFRETVKRFLPSIDKYQLLPDSAGIRPQLRGKRRFQRLRNKTRKRQKPVRPHKPDRH